MASESAAARELIDSFADRSADGRFAALRSLVPGMATDLDWHPFPLAVAGDVSEDDLMRIEAVRVFEILRIKDDPLAEKCRQALVELARNDDAWMSATRPAALCSTCPARSSNSTRCAP